MCVVECAAKSYNRDVTVTPAGSGASRVLVRWSSPLAGAAGTPAAQPTYPAPAPVLAASHSATGTARHQDSWEWAAAAPAAVAAAVAAVVVVDTAAAACALQ